MFFVGIIIGIGLRNFKEMIMRKILKWFFKLEYQRHVNTFHYYDDCIFCHLEPKYYEKFK